MPRARNPAAERLTTTVLAEAAGVRVAGVLAILVLLWGAVGWAVSLP